MNLLTRTGYLFTIGLLIVQGAWAQNDFCGIRNTSFQEGERMHFKVYYNVSKLWIGAGDAVFTTALEELNGRKVYHITGDGRTSKSYEMFYKVRDNYESFIDVETMLPVKFIRNVNEGGFKIYNNVTFNQKIGQAVSTKGIYTVPRCVQDVLSTIYYARNIDYNKYKPGDKIPFSMFLDDQVYHLYIRYMGKEEVTTRYGKFNAIKIVPLLIEGTIFKGGEKMQVWVSDDNNHLPLRIESPILIGSVKVDLMGYDNLRNPVTSLIKKK
ncbi:MAG: DUF3108 domain-containing protein [Taibaiella sp.]|nr:DUF3108 domain-containing protein [Taibaiella sp.]